MAIKTVVYVGDKRLRQKAKQVKQFTPGLKQLAQDMLETMRSHEGVGLAAPQIGVMQRIFVAEIPCLENDDIPPHPQCGKTYILVNPEVVRTAKSQAEAEEGCLSIPGLRGLVNRPEWVHLKAQDVTGRKIKVKTDDLLARVFLHEIDHLDGILYTERIKDPKKLWEITIDEPEARAEAIQKAS